MQGFHFPLKRSAGVFLFWLAGCAFLFFPFQAHAQTLGDLQKKIKALEEKLRGYESIRKELDSLKDMVKGVQKEQETQKAKMAEVEPLKKTLEGLSKVSISGGATGIIQSTSGISDSPGSPGDDIFSEGSFDIIFEYEPMKNWKVLLDLEAIGGDGPDNIANLHGLNGDGGTTDPNVTILEAWLEGVLFDGRLTLTAGKIDVTNYIDGNAYAADETSQFLSGSLVNNAVFTAPGNGPGVRLRLDVLKDMVYLEGVGMTQDSNSDGNTADRSLTDIYAAVEVGVTPKLFGRPGTYRIWATIDKAGRKRKLSGAVEDVTALGFGLSADQELADWVGVFFRIAARDSDNLNYTTRVAWSAGAEISKIIPSRADDVIGLAYGEITPTKRDFGARVGEEGFIEAYYRWVFNENFQLSGIFQHIVDPNGNSRADDVSVFGVRAQANF